jgi:NAD(P)-dependent dehydrogenase (short-subunit alcohol dehydrogenase family)
MRGKRMKNVAGKVAFITGGATGIGYGLVQNFLKLGMRVVAVDFNREYLHEKAPRDGQPPARPAGEGLSPAGAMTDGVSRCVFGLGVSGL